jgi:hypothetical protein
MAQDPVLKKIISEIAADGDRRRAEVVLAEDPQIGSIAVCCSGGGIRSAAFNLGAMQVLQESLLYPKVSTVSAVSGGSYMAAGHALAAHRLRTGPAAAAGPPAYALGSPEETNLREHTRYLLPKWRTTSFGVLALLLGLVVNLVLVGAVLFIVGRSLGWGLRAAGILTGLDGEQPRVQPSPVWIICAVLAGAGVLISWITYLYVKPAPADRDNEPRPVRVSWWLLVAAAVAAIGLVAAPAAIKSLYDVGRDNTGAAGTVVRDLGFSSQSGCAAEASSAARTTSKGQPPKVCGAPATSVDAAAENGNASRKPATFGGGFLAFVAALSALIRTASGKVRTYAKDLDQQAKVKRAVDGLGRFARDKLAPWLGTALVVAAAIVLGLRWIGEGATDGIASAAGHWWDQQWLQVAGVGLLLVIIKVLVDINHTSLHRYYRDRLASAYAAARKPDGIGISAAGHASLSELADATPELVICAAANCNRGGGLPPGRGAVSFTFTGKSIGLSMQPAAAEDDPLHRVETQRYEQFLAGFTLFDAVAVSGAAVAPVMGKMTQPTKRVLFALGNVRLGVWLPAPEQIAGPAGGRLATIRRRFWQPDIKRLWAEAAGVLHIRGKWLFVTDGGHYDNLGLVEALRRRPDAVIVFDAAGDGQGSFATLGEAIALARTETGCDVTINPTAITPAQDREVPSTVAAGDFRYRNDRDRKRRLFYAKLGVSDGHPWDVRAYLRNHPTFPTASTIQQLYDGDEFEAYRAMGEATARALLDQHIPPDPPPRTVERVAPAAGDLVGVDRPGS